VPLDGVVVNVVDHAIEFGIGSGGLGGNPQSTSVAGDY
jgi:hypothetical protein